MNKVLMVEVILVLLIVFTLGCVTGMLYTAPSSNVEDYMNGKATFCQLTEKERFQVCPSQRVHVAANHGGEVTRYVCSKNNGYIRVLNLTEKSKAEFNMAKFRLKVGGLSVTQVCSDDEGDVYRVKPGNL